MSLLFNFAKIRHIAIFDGADNEDKIVFFGNRPHHPYRILDAPYIDIEGQKGRVSTIVTYNPTDYE